MMPKSQYIVVLLAFFFFVHCKNEEKVVVGVLDLPQININYDSLNNPQKVSCVIYAGKNFSLKGEIKQRGGSSIGYPKKSYTVKLKDSKSLFGLPKNKKWIFNASYLEKSLIRNILSYELFRDWNPTNFSPKIELIEFFHNNNYEGIYQLTEKVDEVSLGFKNKSKGSIFKDCAVFSKTPIEPQSGETYYHQKYPKSKKKDLTEYMDSLKAFILDTSGNNFDNNVELMFDIDNVIDWQIMIMLSNNGDAVYKNFYLYRKGKREKFKIALWDYDSGFGRDTDNELNLMKTTSHWERNSLLDRLYNKNVNNYQARLHARWKELRENGKISISNFENRVDVLVEKLELHVSRNFERWPVTDSHYWDEYTWEQEIEVLKEFINLRIPQLDKKFNYNGR